MRAPTLSSAALGYKSSKCLFSRDAISRRPVATLLFLRLSSYRCGKSRAVIYSERFQFNPYANSRVMTSIIGQVIEDSHLQFLHGREDSENMIYLNMLQLCFWFGLSYSLFASAGTIGATLINSSLNANASNRLDRPQEREAPVCVDYTRHPMWGLTSEVFDFTTCQQSVELLRPNIASFLYHSYDFYSRRVYPSGIGPTLSGAWPLVQGTATG